MTGNAKQYDGPRLLVPISVAALVVNQPVQNGIPFARWQMDYDNLKQLQSPMPTPFESLGQNKPEPSIHLHWALPEALTHGTQTGLAGAIDFPLAPNRWLVARFAPGPNATDKHTVTAWVLISDYLDPEKGSNPYLNPFPSTPGQAEKTQLGTVIPLDAWDDETSRQPLFLKALGPGDVTFARYTPGIQNVFTFRDDTTKIASGTNLTYLVMGWYSDVVEDPLYGATTPEAWEALLGQLNWSIAGTVGDVPPNQTLIHGMIRDVQWQTTAIPPRANDKVSDIPTNVKVAVGHTSIDALAALIEDEMGTDGVLDAELLEAFQYNILSTLDQPGGQAELDKSIRQVWFGADPGGTWWQIVAKTRTDTAKVQSAPQIPEKDKQWLATLNTQQHTLDQERRLLESMQWALYGYWWKNKKANLASYYPQYPPDNYAQIVQELGDAVDKSKAGSFINQVIAQQNKVNQLAGTLPDPHDAASIQRYAASKGLAEDLVLRPSAMPRFWHSGDPVVLVQGLGFAGKQTAGGVLQCRLPGQTVTGITVDDKTVTATQLAADIPVPNNAKLPGQVQALSQEVFFLDPGNAPIIAEDGLHTTDQTMIETIAADMEAMKNLQGVPPIPLAVAAWGQAWLPLFLDWMLAFHPTVNKNNDEWQLDQTNWVFNGDDYDWTGGDVPSDHFQTYLGRTFLTPQVAFTFGERLRQYLKDNPNVDLQKVEDFLDKVAQWDFLSQTLSGFNEQLIMRDLEQNIPPGNDVVQQVNNRDDGVPDVGRGDVDNSFGGGPPFFFPVRGGFFQFEKLMVVDAFGQVVDLLYANMNAAEMPPPSSRFAVGGWRRAPTIN